MVYIKIPKIKHDMMKSLYFPRMFRYRWYKDRRKLVKITEAFKNCQDLNIPVYLPSAVFTSHVKYEEFDIPVQAEEVDTRPNVYMISKESVLLDGWEIPSLQHLTNTVVFNNLPERISNIENCVENEEEVKESLAYAQLTDNTISFLDFVRKPFNPHKYCRMVDRGIPYMRRMDNTTTQILNLMARYYGYKRIIKNIPVSTNHRNDEDFSVMYDINSVVTSDKPLSPIINANEIGEYADSKLPDMYPISPYAELLKQKQPIIENNENCFRSQFPHTVVKHIKCSQVEHVKPLLYAGIACLLGFNVAAKVAETAPKDSNNDLLDPVTVNVIVHNGRHFQFGVYQLNTLSLRGSTRNLFWHEPWNMMFYNAVFDRGAPSLVDFNNYPYQIMRNMYTSQ